VDLQIDSAMRVDEGIPTGKITMPLFLARQVYLLAAILYSLFHGLQIFSRDGPGK
jgi:hypothetical protein